MQSLHVVFRAFVGAVVGGSRESLGHDGFEILSLGSSILFSDIQYRRSDDF